MVLFTFAYKTNLRKKLGQLQKQKRSIQILQSAKGKSREILAHSFTLKTLDLSSLQTKLLHDSMIL